MGRRSESKMRHAAQYGITIFAKAGVFHGGNNDLQDLPQTVVRVDNPAGIVLSCCAYLLTRLRRYKIIIFQRDIRCRI